jgi:anionic cell wall polymer biosynthesis LytR-Cps2A-Psr (LCP) family protein
VKTNAKDASGALLIAIVLLLAAGVAAALFALRGDPVKDAISDDRVINTLFVIEQNVKPLSSFVLMYYPATKRAAFFDVPGDLGLLIRRINRVDRIDRVYEPDRIASFENEIEMLLGLDINFSIVITLDNLARIVDLIGGVELFIPAPVDSGGGEEELVRFPSGITRLDGDKSALYVRCELPGEEREMAVFRRQRFFLGFLKRLGETNSLLKQPAVSPLFQSFLTTGMSRRTRIRLFDEFAGMDTDRASVQSVGGNWREVSGQMLLIPYYDGSLVKDIARQTLGSLTRSAGGSANDRVFTVEVLNGTAVSGLAGRTAELLRGFGYDVIAIGNADQTSYDETAVVVNRSGFDDQARDFAEIIRCENIRTEMSAPDSSEGEGAMPNFEYRSDFTLIIGRDFNGRYVTGN